MVETAIVYTSSCANSVALTIKNHTENEKFCPKMPFFDLWPPYAVQKMSWSSPNDYHLKDHWHSNIIHKF